MQKAVDINADLGEGFGAYELGNDQAMLDIVSSANVACGFHAGDPKVMQNTVRLAHARSVSIGAHPSFPDLQGFGRRAMDIPSDELAAIIAYQIGALIGLAKANAAEVAHVKPHGALNNLAAVDIELARVVVKAIGSVNPSLILLAPAASALSVAGKESGLAVAQEIFADRAYDDDGYLLSRSEEGAVYHDAQQCVDQVLNFLEEGAIVCKSGKKIITDIHSICVHGDTPQSVEIAKHIRQAIVDKGAAISSLTRLAHS